MWLSRILLALTLAFALALTGSGCDDNPTIVSLDDLAPPLGLTSVTGDGAVGLCWQASSFGEDREGSHAYQAGGAQPATPGESIPGVLGTPAVATLTTSQESGSLTATAAGLVNSTTCSFLVVTFKDRGDKLSLPSNVMSDTPRRASAARIRDARYASHSVEVLVSHVYAVFTGDNHDAKIWGVNLHGGASATPVGWPTSRRQGTTSLNREMRPDDGGVPDHGQEPDSGIAVSRAL